MGGHVSTTVTQRQDHSRKVGEALLDRLLSEKDVDGLSALSRTWRDSLVPKESVEGQNILRALEEIQGSFLANRKLSSKLHTKFQDLQLRMRSFFDQRLGMYKDSLEKNAKAAAQVRSLLKCCDSLYRSSYDNAFDTQIRWGDSKALREWEMFVSGQSNILKTQMQNQSLAQSSNTLVRCFEDAIAVRSRFVSFFSDVAADTSGTFCEAPMKSIFRAFEKTAMRPLAQRYMCDNVYDIVRGNIVFDSMGGVLAAARAICTSPHFVVCRLKDRFSPRKETSGGWRDALINGYFKSDRSMHLVEIQIHHRALLTVRKDLGGHFMYSKFRALSEAFETVLPTLKLPKQVPKNAIPSLESRKSTKTRVIVLDKRRTKRSPSSASSSSSSSRVASRRRRPRMMTAPSSISQTNANMRLTRSASASARPGDSDVATKSDSHIMKGQRRRRRRRGRHQRSHTVDTPASTSGRSRSPGLVEYDLIEQGIVSPLRRNSDDVGANTSAGSSLSTSPDSDTLDPMDISPRKARPIASSKMPEVSPIRPLAARVMKLSPTSRMRTVEMLLESSPSRREAIASLMRGQKRQDVLNRETLRSIDSTPPPDSPMFLRDRARKAAHRVRDRSYNSFVSTEASPPPSPFVATSRKMPLKSEQGNGSFLHALLGPSSSLIEESGLRDRRTSSDDSHDLKRPLGRESFSGGFSDSSVSPQSPFFARRTRKSSVSSSDLSKSPHKKLRKSPRKRGD